MLNCKGLGLLSVDKPLAKVYWLIIFLSVTYSGICVKRNKRILLAYIKRNEDGPVLIDVVELTRNGHSFRLNGDLWKRNFALFLGDLCTHQNGENMLIKPLSRREVPSWVEGCEIIVAAAAQEKYDLWLKHGLINSDSFI